MKLRQLGSNQTELTATKMVKGITDYPAELTVLFSYETPVACHVEGVGYFRTEKKWSVTTSLHINKWIDANGGSEAEQKPQTFFDSLIS